MKDRLKQIRKALDITQVELAEALNVSKGTIANYETGRNEPIDAVVLLICQTYNVNEKWLRTGEGEMFRERANDELEAFFDERHATKQTRTIIRKYLELPECVQDRVSKWICDVADKIREGKEPLEIPSPQMSDEELHEEMDRQLSLEKRQAAK